MVRVCVLAGSRSVQHLHVVVLLSLSKLQLGCSLVKQETPV